MQKLTERELIKRAITEGLRDFRGETKWRKKLCDSLSALDPETCTSADVNKAMDGRFWQRPYCEECDSLHDEVILFGTADPYGECEQTKQLCKDCLRKALEL